MLSVVVFLIVGIIMGSGTKGGKERDRRLPIIFYQIDMEYNNDSDIIWYKLLTQSIVLFELRIQLTLIK